MKLKKAIISKPKQDVVKKVMNKAKSKKVAKNAKAIVKNIK